MVNAIRSEKTPPERSAAGLTTPAFAEARAAGGN